jgi:hypothetical protein
MQSFSKITFLEMVLKAFTTSTYRTTQSRWMFKTIWMPWTITLHPLIVMSNAWSDKQIGNILWNSKHKGLFINQYKTFLITISQMLPKGLTKAKSLPMPKTRTINLGIWPITMWEHIWKSCEKLLTESKSKSSWKSNKES